MSDIDGVCFWWGEAWRAVGVDYYMAIGKFGMERQMSEEEYELRMGYLRAMRQFKVGKAYYAWDMYELEE